MASYLLEARRKFDRREITQEQLRELEDRAILEAVNVRREVGIKSFTDGEYRFHDGFFEYLEGFEEIRDPPSELFKPYAHRIWPQFTNNTKPPITRLCTSEIRWVKSRYKPQFEALKALVHPDEVKNIKVTMPGPEWFHLRHGNRAFRPDVCPDRAAYFNDIAAAYRQELDVLYAAGCRNTQIDDPLLTYFCDVSIRKGLKEDNDDPDVLLDTYIRLHNNCLATRPQDMTVGLHLCRGNYKSNHFSEGGYDAIAVKLFNEINVDCYYLEYDTERAGTFEPLKHLPKDKSVVLGLVTSKFPALEDKTDLKERLFEAARIVASGTGEAVEEALQRICISPQCGFASHKEGNLLDADDVKKKLQLVKELATSVWEDV